MPNVTRYGSGDGTDDADVKRVQGGCHVGNITKNKPATVLPDRRLATAGVVSMPLLQDLGL